jgi:hypothetical protein
MTNEPNPQHELMETKAMPDIVPDSHPPLVVDLPDGQKLFVGEVNPGTIIEVATWRGTGRPDSRTNRFMLGVSTPEDDAKDALPRQIENTQFMAAQPVQQSAVQPEPKYVSSVVMATKQEESLTSTTANLYGGRTPVENKLSNLPVHQPREAKSNKKSISISVSALAKSLGSLAAVAAIVGICAGPLQMGFINPSTGLQSKFGSAQNSIVLVKKAAEYDLGARVVANLAESEASPSLSMISGTGAKASLLDTPVGFQPVPAENIYGEVVLVFPYIGWLFNL